MQTAKVHLSLKSVMRDSYDSLHTVATASLDIPLSETVETFKGKVLGLLGEYAELYDVHHSQCRFLVGSKVITPEEDNKTLSEIGVDHDGEVHVVLPIGHAPASPKQPAAVLTSAAASSTLPSSSVAAKHVVHLELKSVLRDSYDSFHTAAKASLDIDLDTETVESFKTKALVLLGEFTEIRDVHHTKCHFTVGTSVIGADKDGLKCKDAGIDHNCEVHVILPHGHDSVLCK